MDCPRCGAALPDGTRDFGSDRAGVAVVVTGVPAARCESCRETFTTAAVQARLEELGEQARRQAVEEGKTEVRRAWSEPPALRAEVLAGQLQGLVARLQEATVSDDPARMTAVLAEISGALTALVDRAREAGIDLPPPPAGSRDHTDS